MSDSYTKYCEDLEKENYLKEHGELKKNENKDGAKKRSSRQTIVKAVDKNALVLEYTKKYVRDHLDKSDDVEDFDVYVVWQCYILGNAKWLVSTTLPDGMYYEVTYNAQKSEFYFDAYKKFDNRSFKTSDV